MTTLRTRDVLDQAHAFHTQLAGYFAGLSDAADNERVRLLYSYLSQHEQLLSQILTRYRGDAPSRLMDAWLQNVPDDRALHACAVLDLQPDTDPDDVVTASLSYDDCLISLYKAMQEASTQQPEVKELFDTLLALEENEKHRTTLNMQSLYDW